MVHRGVGTSVLHESPGYETKRSIGSDLSRPLGAEDLGFAGTLCELVPEMVTAGFRYQTLEAVQMQWQF